MSKLKKLSRDQKKIAALAANKKIIDEKDLAILRMQNSDDN
jgi:hypothetical protein